MRRAALPALLLAGVLALVAACGGSGGGDASGGAKPALTVSAAASLKSAFTAYGRGFRAASARFSFAGSDELAAQIEQAREDGFAVDHEESDEDLTCIAAAVPPARPGPAQYALSISFLTHRLDAETIDQVGQRVRSAAREIGARLY